MIRTLKSLIADTNPLRLTYHRLKGVAAAVRYGFPGRRLAILAVTGTDGKTTTVAMTAHILHAAGKKVGASSTAFFEINGERTANPTQKTSPSAFMQQKFLRTLVNKGCTHAVIEASSHGLVQGRLAGIRPKVAAITNLSAEHLDYHKTMQEYLAAKARLFRMLRGKGTKVLNADDESYATLKDLPSTMTLTYGSEKRQGGEPLSLHIDDIDGDASATTATIYAHDASHLLQLPIPGRFNVFNAACAIACADAIGIPIEHAVQALASFRGAPGRMQKIDEGQSFHVYIDFTVTPAAYEQTLSGLKAGLADGARLLVLTGSCGDRMKEKRPLVGKICAAYADVVVVTNEDPYTEDPEKIIDEVMAGIPDDLPAMNQNDVVSGEHHTFAMRISDRLEAIRFLLRHAKPNDIVLFCGKGGDTMMWTKKGQVPWDEEKILRRELKQLKY